MKKILLYSLILLLVVVITVTGTYAYFVSTIGSNNGIISGSSKLEVIYTGGTEISGPLDLSTSKEGGRNTTVNIKLSEDSVDASADLYIHINSITSTIATDALNWEVYKTYNGEVSFVDSGTFLDCDNNGSTKKCTNGDKIYIVNDYELTTTDTYFTVYVWLNGDKVGNEVIGASLNSYIGAETELITTNLQ